MTDREKLMGWIRETIQGGIDSSFSSNGAEVEKIGEAGGMTFVRVRYLNRGLHEDGPQDVPTDRLSVWRISVEEALPGTTFD